MERKNVVLALHQFAFGVGITQGVARFIKNAPNGKRWSVLVMQPLISQIPLLEDFKPDGVMLQVTDREFLNALSRLKHRSPTVIVGEGVDDPPYPVVRPDNVAVGRLAAEYLLGLGLTQYAYIGIPDQRASRMREQGFREQVERAGRRCFVHHTHRMLWNPNLAACPRLDSPAHKDVQAWLEELPKPIGVMACNDPAGAEVSDICRFAGIRVPEDVALIGVDNSDLICELASPPLSSVELPLVQMGYEASSLLDNMISGTEPDKPELVFSSNAVVKRSSSDILAVNDDDVAAVLTYIRKHACDGIRVDDAMDCVSVSRTLMERKFKQHIGRTLGAEIRRVRLEQAKKLLIETDWSVTRVAVNSGFKEVQRLNELFRREMKITPTAYRKQMRA